MFRIYTEDKNLGAILGIVGSYFEGFTVYKTLGVWQGKKESSLVIEIVENKIWSHKVKEAAQRIKKHNKQKAILVTYTSGEERLI